MTRDEALADLTSILEARTAGVGFSNFEHGVRIPAELAGELAKTAIQWAVENGLPLRVD